MKKEYQHVVYAILFLGLFFGYLYLNNPGENEIWKPENYSIINEAKTINEKLVYVPESSHEESGWSNTFEEFKRSFKDEHISITALRDGNIIYSVDIDSVKYYTKGNYINDSDLITKYITEEENVLILHEERDMFMQLFFALFIPFAIFALAKKIKSPP